MPLKTKSYVISVRITKRRLMKKPPRLRLLRTQAIPTTLN